MKHLLKIVLGKLVFIVFFTLLAFIYFQYEYIVIDVKNYSLQQKTAKTTAIINKEKTKNEVIKLKVAANIKEANLNNARGLYWEGEFQKSISEYQMLLKKDPKNIDYHGELANLYFNQKSFDKATIEFVTTAKLLIDKQNDFRAKQILGVLYTLDKVAAEDVQIYLDQHNYKLN